MKWTERLGWGAAAANSVFDGVSDGVQDYQTSKSVGHAAVESGKTFVTDMAAPAVYAAARYAGLCNPYMLGATAFAYAMAPTPAL